MKWSCRRMLLIHLVALLMLVGVVCAQETASNEAAEGDTILRAFSDLPNRPGLPDPFRRPDGTRVGARDEWPAQREHLKSLLSHYMYGQMPSRPTRDQIAVALTAKLPAFDGAAFEERYTLTLTRNGRSARLRFALIRPKENRRYPTIIKNCRALFDKTIAIEKYHATIDRDLAAARDAIDRGYVLCKFRREDFASDKKNNRNSGVFPLYPEPGYDWGSIAVWAWTHQLVLDALNTLGYADMDRIVATGHSRGGQTAIAAGIFDERIDVVVPCTGGYGACGTLRIRDPKGVRSTMDYIAHLKKNVPHWFNARYLEFADEAFFGKQGTSRFNEWLNPDFRPELAWTTPGN